MKENALLEIKDLFNVERYMKPSGKILTERGILLSKFSEKIGKPIPYVAFRLTKVPLCDLYHMDKQCSNYKGGYAKCWYGSLKVKK